jgi:hypothetical protein
MTGLAEVNHPLCMVKVNVFDSSLPMQGKPCRCTDGSFPIPLCTGQDYMDLQGADCPDGSKPTDQCQDGSTCQVGSSSAPTATTAAPAQDVRVTYTIANLDYNKVDTNATLKNEIVDAVKEGVLASLTGYAKSDIIVALSAGSIVAEVTIAPKSGTTAEALKSTVDASKAAMETSVTTKVTEVEGVDKALSSGMTLSDVSTTSVVEVAVVPTPSPSPNVDGAPPILSRWKAFTIAVASAYVALVAC